MPITDYVPSFLRGWMNVPIPGSTGVDNANSDRPVPARLQRAIDQFNAGQDHGWTSFKGSSRPSRRSDLAEQPYIEPMNRRLLLRQLKRMRVDDPMIASGLQILTHGAVGDGFTLVFPWDKDRETTEQQTARHALEDAYKTMYPHLCGWCEDWVGDGDLFVQIVADENSKPVRFEQMPVAGMERLSDHTDRFPDPARAYKQRDTLTIEEYSYFSDFELVHARYRRQSNERYGQSELFPARQSSIDALKGFSQLIKRRMRSNPKEVHEFSKPLSPMALLRYVFGIPGKPETALPQERAKQGDESAVESPDGYTIANGAQVKIIQGDPRFNEIGDLLALVDRALAVLKVPRALINGDVVNYATLQALLSQLYAIQRILCRAFELAVIRPIFDRVLLLAGLLPETVKYEIDWGQRFTAQEMKDQAEVANKAFQVGGLSIETYVGIQFQLYQRKDVQAEIERIKKDRREGLLPLVKGVADEINALRGMAGDPFGSPSVAGTTRDNLGNSGTGGAADNEKENERIM